MKTYILAAVASLAFATPAFAADFAGPRVGATLGIAGDDPVDTDAVTFGVEAGYDWQIGTGAVVGVQAEYQNDFDNDFGRELAATARVGGIVGDRALIYVAGGYSNIDVGPFSVDGVRAGLGVEFNIGNSGANLKVEQRYGNYELGAELFQTVVGIGYRF